MVFEENINNIKAFYASDSYKNEFSGKIEKIKEEICKIYKDPDKSDPCLIKEARNYGNKFEMEFSPDGICGWKLLFDVYSQDGDESWIEKYEIIRGSKYGELYFPCKRDKDRNLTINTERNFKLGDRADIFLYDFKLKIEKPDMKCKLKYKNKDSIKFVEYYRKKENGFSEYIKDFELKDFVKKDEQRGTINVINIETGQPMIFKEYENFSWNNRMEYKKKKDKMKKYLDELVSICKKTKRPMD